MSANEIAVPQCGKRLLLRDRSPTLDGIAMSVYGIAMTLGGIVLSFSDRERRSDMFPKPN